MFSVFSRVAATGCSPGKASIASAARGMDAKCEEAPKGRKSSQESAAPSGLSLTGTSTPHLRAGQLLAELENRNLAGAVAENQGALDQAEANYQSVSRGTTVEELQKAESEVKAAKDTMDAAQKVFDAKQGLYTQGAIAQKE